MGKIIFIDVDGTLVTQKNGKDYIPQSAIEAIRHARAHGHCVYLCTGRSLGELHENIIEIGFDGIIGAAGAFVIQGNEYLFKQQLSRSSVLKILDDLYARNVMCILETNTHNYGKDNIISYIRDTVGNQQWADSFRPFEGCDYDDVNKITFVSLDMPYEEIAQRFRQDYHIVEGSFPIPDADSGEISVLGSSKGVAIQRLVAALGADMKDTVGIGDSMNDQAMFDVVHTSIAMGNGVPKVKEMADFVTKNVEDDGIAYAFAWLGL